tara:strand:+ start:836 stop:1009 length:174 start_codon:yes stop_codon:yes gene_type:complete
MFALAMARATGFAGNNLSTRRTSPAWITNATATVTLTVVVARFWTLRSVVHSSAIVT